MTAHHRNTAIFKMCPCFIAPSDRIDTSQGSTRLGTSSSEDVSRTGFRNVELENGRSLKKEIVSVRNIPSSKPHSAELETFIHRIVKRGKNPRPQNHETCRRMSDEGELKSPNFLSEGIFYGLTERCRSGGIISLYEATWSFALRRAKCR